MVIDSGRRVGVDRLVDVGVRINGGSVDGGGGDVITGVGVIAGGSYKLIYSCILSSLSVLVPDSFKFNCNNTQRRPALCMSLFPFEEHIPTY